MTCGLCRTRNVWSLSNLTSGRIWHKIFYMGWGTHESINMHDRHKKKKSWGTKWWWTQPGQPGIAWGWGRISGIRRLVRLHPHGANTRGTPENQGFGARKVFFFFLLLSNRWLLHQVIRGDKMKVVTLSVRITILRELLARFGILCPNNRKMNINDGSRVWRIWQSLNDWTLHDSTR